MSSKPWYKDGLRFECTQCGDCCTGTPGLVLFNSKEAAGMASVLHLSTSDFLTRYATPSDLEDHWQMDEVETDFGFDCALLGRCADTGKTWCNAHQERPSQCRTWPFWPDNLRNRRSWERAGRECEGVGRGEFVSLRVIQQDMRDTPAWGNTR